MTVPWFSCLAVLISQCLSGCFHQSNPETREIVWFHKKKETRFNKGILNKDCFCRPVIQSKFCSNWWFHFLKWQWNTSRTKIVHDWKQPRHVLCMEEADAACYRGFFLQRQKEIKLSLKPFVVKQLLSGCRSNLDPLKDDHFHSAAIWYSNCENKCVHTPRGQTGDHQTQATTHCCVLRQQRS